MFNKIVNNLFMQEISNNTEKQILVAAEKEFVERGFAGARTTSIASSAGVTHAMLHYYFRTKEQLFEKVVDEKMDVLVQSVMDSFSSVRENLSFVERISCIIRVHYCFLADNERLPLFLLNEILSNPTRKEMLVSKARNKVLPVAVQLETQMRDAVVKGEICSIDLLTLVVDIISLNIISIIAKPLILPLSGLDDERYHNWRCEENVRTILLRLNPTVSNDE